MEILNESINSERGCDTPENGQPAESRVSVESHLRGFYARNERIILGAIAVVLFLTIWEAIGRSGKISPVFLSSPCSISLTALKMIRSGEIFKHLYASGTEFLLGFSLAVFLAVPLGLLTGLYRRMNYLFDPFISMFYVTPRIALLPLIILWLGIGLVSKVMVVFLGAFFPICINVIAGVRTVDRDHLLLAKSFRSSDFHTLRTIIVPSCAPFILSGLRLAVGRALVGVFVSELYGASAGIGFLISISGTTFQTDKVFVGIAIIAAFGILCNGIISRAERKIDKWRPQ
jgi:ABC-type nitrate/sulfonate/bicarbonate transport system permease component